MNVARADVANVARATGSSVSGCPTDRASRSPGPRKTPFRKGGGSAGAAEAARPFASFFSFFSFVSGGFL
jgi:hypothetical protein